MNSVQFLSFLILIRVHGLSGEVLGVIIVCHIFG